MTAKKKADGHHLHVVIPHDLWERVQKRIERNPNEKLNARLAILCGLRLFLEGDTKK
jgi:hypothetical protein